MKWEVGQTVEVQSRTWAGINKPGGCAKITKVHFAADGLNVESIDVKYVLGGGCEKEIDPAIISLFETLERGGRKRRGRDFLMKEAGDILKKMRHAIQSNGPKSTTAAPKVTKHPSRATKEPDQSTTLSTPITPEHPSMSRGKAPKKSVISVPSYIIADRAVEVSPLHVDRSVVESKKCTVARRGLFGRGTTLPVNEEKKGETLEKAAIATAAVKSLPVPNSSDPAVGYDSFHNTSQAVQQAHATALKDSLTAKQGKGVSKFVGKQAPLEDRKPPTRLTCSPKNKNTMTSLRGVFDYELRKARAFLDEVCRAPCGDCEEDDPASKENRLNTSASEGEEDRKPSAIKNRREEFLDLFRTLRRKFDDEDGTMNEAAFRSLIESKAPKAFSNKELDENLEFLYKDGKLMKSDGILYIID